ncbi:Gcn5-related n-acetyltransferase [Phytophthora cinnamomi]|uniref:Gcn5-related n-acetyltransferase n=1 Tax=Phytophthora cinnamomi TaxID=4785 RepID=UPI00355A3EC7|nr:Gcn5-related n-acetyltransferase [Phytophthora cinnamomi]
MIYKDRNCDVLLFSILDGDCNFGLKKAFERWLEPSNIDACGGQQLELSELTAPFMPEIQANPKGNSPAVNELGQPVGFAVQAWTSPLFPPHSTLVRRYCQLEPLNAARHARDFWDAQSDDPKGANWTYMLNGPFSSFKEFEEYCLGTEKSREPQIYAVVVDGHAAGMIAYMRVEPSHGVMEV